ncbi:MAG: hypothetical protein LBH67_02890 [Rickettsia sp.]|nr:hypothetical protein [Rickettsia sp.]
MLCKIKYLAEQKAKIYEKNCNLLKILEFCFFFLKLEQIFIFQRSHYIFFLLSPFSLIKL